jgi:hypothetical protein
MKNIHVLPTDKPSRLYFWENELRIGNLTTAPKNLGIFNQNIYITSDEEIKEGDYFIAYSATIDKKPYISCASEYKERKKEKGKIILTTDVDLIKDGVQAIDDEFLEWFVKNPSCEEIEVQDISMQYHEEGYYEYEIIIPKEEPKQETLEEAKAQAWIDFAKTNKDVDMYSFVIGFDKGCKLAQHQSYSEEEVYSIMRMCLGMKESGKTDIEIMEQFEKLKK